MKIIETHPNILLISIHKVFKHNKLQAMMK